MTNENDKKSETIQIPAVGLIGIVAVILPYVFSYSVSSSSIVNGIGETVTTNYSAMIAGPVAIICGLIWLKSSFKTQPMAMIWSLILLALGITHCGKAQTVEKVDNTAVHSQQN